MSLPPQVLRIKRKRTDEPVDSLYLQPDASPSKRRVTTGGHDFVFKRLVDPTVQEASVSNTVNIPMIVTSASGAEQAPLQYLDRHQKPGIATGQSPKRSSRRKSSLVPRKFQLSRAATLRSTPASTTDARQRRNLDVAVFVEQHEGIGKAQPSLDSHDTLMTDVSLPSGTSPSPKKRPSTPATASRPSKSEAQVARNEEPGFYEALQQYAAEEEHKLSIKQPIPQRDLSWKQEKRNGLQGAETMEMSGDEMEIDYIYDTYIRYANTLESLPDKLPDSNDQDTGLDQGNPRAQSPTYGYLIIPEANQTLWETFYTSEGESESEHDWDSEEDDENHENWYGADYPEDEVSSEDDRGENPYRYRRGSDDLDEWDSHEEHDSDEGDESDEEHTNWDGVTRRMAGFTL